MDDISDHLIDPCNHLCLCGGCAKQSLKECPICRGSVNKFTKIFSVGIIDDARKSDDDDGDNGVIVQEEKKKLQDLTKEIETLRAQASTLRQQLQQAQVAKASSNDFYQSLEISDFHEELDYVEPPPPQEPKIRKKLSPYNMYVIDYMNKNPGQGFPPKDSWSTVSKEEVALYQAQADALQAQADRLDAQDSL